MGSSPLSRPARAISILTAAAVAVAGFFVAAPAAFADTSPAVPNDPANPATVTADPLPTVQIDGIVWGQAIVGNTVYAVGKFGTARPAGSAAGVNTTPRNNMLAYNIETGNLVTSFNPDVNGQILGISASPDGKRLYIVGDFNKVGGVSYWGVAAIDTATGKAIPSFKPAPSSQVRTVVATNDTVYLGGTFTGINSQPRKYAAALNASDGSLTGLVADTDAVVDSIALTNNGKLVLGGRFTTINGVANIGMGAVDAASGAVLAWNVNKTVTNSGKGSSITSLYAVGDRVYGTGYDYYGTGNLEGTFAANTTSGDIDWIENCRGDSYGVWANDKVTYIAGHPHDCSYIGGFPDTWNPRAHWNSIAFSHVATHPIDHDGMGMNIAGIQAPNLLDWFPTWGTANVSGAGQATWTVTGNDRYVVYGGEFPWVQGVQQQGLVRFAVPSIAPKKVAPNVNTDLVPNAVSFAAGEARITWLQTFDRDNGNLTYKLVRDGNTANPVYQETAHSTFWNRKQMGFVDKGLAPGSTHSYRLYVTDPDGNSISRLGNTVTVAATSDSTPYSDSVKADAPSIFYPLGEGSGTTVYDHAGFNDGTAQTGVTRGAQGVTSGSTATTFSGTDSGTVATNSLVDGPQTFSVEAWFKTTSTKGGKIVGFGSSKTGNSGSYDRQVMMSDDGRLTFGVYPNEVRTVQSGTGYNDGQWHHVVASLGSNGMRLYVDDSLVDSRTDTTSAQSYQGYWRIGGDNYGGWPNSGSSWYFNGDIANVAVYSTPLTLKQVDAHWTAAGRTSTIPAPPSDAYGAAVVGADPDLYWRFDGAAKGYITDSGSAGRSGRIEDGLTFGGGAAGVPGQSGIFNGGRVIAEKPMANPTRFTSEIWFKTTTQQGGVLIGFGSVPDGYSWQNDRKIYMLGDGRLEFGTYPGFQSFTTSDKAYNDGQWHLAAASLGQDGTKLYVDGELVASNSQQGAENYTGYWRVGGDNPWRAPQGDFHGQLDEAAVYSTVLSAETIKSHFDTGKTGVAPNQAPTASFTSTPVNLDASFDASKSADADGTIASYAWDFGDGQTGTGVTPTHTYATPGTYTVTLTVTDDKGATGTAQAQVTATEKPNAAPTAAISSTATYLAASFDGTGSKDSDGSVASYAWDFGDGQTGTGSKVDHTYGTGGTYTVTLTVTDDRGATGTTTKSVTVAPKPNALPTAAFTTQVNGLDVAVDGSGSSDIDGSISAYAWDFGDGSVATGAQKSHTYSAGGTYTVTLSVTDDRGATATKTASVTVQGAVPTNTIAKDAFERTVSGGWGTADTGGAWSVTGGSTSIVQVTNGTGRVNLAPGSTRNLLLNSTQVTDADTTFDFALDKVPTGTGSYTGVVARQAGSDLYIASVWVKPNGTVWAVLKQNGTLLRNVQIPGLTYTAGTKLTARVQVSGSSPTTLSMKVWPTGTTEPGAWQATATDSFGTLQGKGIMGLQMSLGSSATTGDPVSVDNLQVVAAQQTPPPVVNQAPTAGISSSTSNLTASLDGSSSKDSDGQIASYAWDFGDGTTGTGATAQHTYGQAGTYTVTLTVTDDKGATGTATGSVTVTAPVTPPPASDVLAADTFTRTAANGWGSADTGGAWTITGGNASILSVNGSAARAALAAGSTRLGLLSSVSSSATDSKATFAIDAVPTGGGLYAGLVGRQVGSANYAAQVWVRANGAAYLVITQSGTVLSSTPISGLTYSAGTRLVVRMQTVGTSPTTVSAKVWVEGTAEPSSWTSTVTDSTSALQAPGSVGILSSLSGSATAADPITIDDYTVTPVK